MPFDAVRDYSSSTESVKDDYSYRNVILVECWQLALLYVFPLCHFNDSHIFPFQPYMSFHRIIYCIVATVQI